MGKRLGPEPPTVPQHVYQHALELAWKTSARDAMIIETLYETGIRNSECRNLQINDVWRNGDIVLALKLRDETCKNMRPRTIELTHSFRAKLRKWVLEKHGTIEGGLECRPLYPSQMRGGFLTRRGLCRIVAKYFRKVDSAATPHFLRHTCATELLRVSSVRVVQLMLGHKRMETVQIYTHPTADDLRSAMDARTSTREKFKQKNQEIEQKTAEQELDAIERESSRIPQIDPYKNKMSAELMTASTPRPREDCTIKNMSMTASTQLPCQGQ